LAAGHFLNEDSTRFYQVTSVPPKTGDNYLPALAHAITVALSGHRDNAIRSAEHAIEAGRLLTDAKAAVEHGEWQSWLKASCSLSERSAQRYMRLHRAGLKAPRVADLSIRAADMALAKPRERPGRYPDAATVAKCEAAWIDALADAYPKAHRTPVNGFGRLPAPIEALEVFEDGDADFFRAFAVLRESSEHAGYFELFMFFEDGAIMSTKRPVLWEALAPHLVISSSGILSPERWQSRQSSNRKFEIWADLWEDAEQPLAA
jgi:Protein of unknown function (DUF3102)